MKKEALYESHISTTRWLVYDVPGNVGWIMYLVCLIQCFVKWPAFMEIPLVWLSVMVGIIPAVAMAVGIVERTEQFIEEVKAVHAASMTAKERRCYYEPKSRNSECLQASGQGSHLL